MVLRVFRLLCICMNAHVHVSTPRNQESIESLRAEVTESYESLGVGPIVFSRQVSTLSHLNMYFSNL